MSRLSEILEATGLSEQSPYSALGYDSRKFDATFSSLSDAELDQELDNVLNMIADPTYLAERGQLMHTASEINRIKGESIEAKNSQMNMFIGYAVAVGIGILAGMFIKAGGLKSGKIDLKFPKGTGKTGTYPKANNVGGSPSSDIGGLPSGVS